MKVETLALIVLQALEGEECTINPVTGDISHFETITCSDSDRMTVSGLPHTKLLESWINFHFLARMATGESGHRDHTDGLGYGLNVNPLARIYAWRSGTVCGVSAVLVRP